MAAEKRGLEKTDLEATLVFMKRTRDGQYAEIDRASLDFLRVHEQTEPVYDDDKEYFFSIS